MTDEPLWVVLVGRGQGDGALLPDRGSTSVVDVSGGVKSEAAMMMDVVVPGEEPLAVSSGGFDRPELFGEVGSVLQGLECRLAEWVDAPMFCQAAGARFLLWSAGWS